MAAPHSLGKKGSWQSCFERPFIILMPTEIASLINEHVPMNKYRSTFYMYCISAVTRVEVCAGVCFKYAWRTQGSRNWKLWAAACVFQCQTEDPWLSSRQDVSIASLTWSSWKILTLHTEWVGYSLGATGPLCELANSAMLACLWSLLRQGSEGSWSYTCIPRLTQQSNHTRKLLSSWEVLLEVLSGCGIHCNALVHSNIWEETDPKWFKEQRQTSKAILVSQASQWMAPLLLPQEKCPCAALGAEQLGEWPPHRNDPQQEATAGVENFNSLKG